MTASGFHGARLRRLMSHCKQTSIFASAFWVSIPNVPLFGIFILSPRVVGTTLTGFSYSSTRDDCCRVCSVLLTMANPTWFALLSGNRYRGSGVRGCHADTRSVIVVQESDRRCSCARWCDRGCPRELQVAAHGSPRNSRGGDSILSVEGRCHLERH